MRFLALYKEKSKKAEGRAALARVVSGPLVQRKSFCSTPTVFLFCKYEMKLLSAGSVLRSPLTKVSLEVLKELPLKANSLRCQRRKVACELAHYLARGVRRLKSKVV